MPSAPRARQVSARTSRLLGRLSLALALTALAVGAEAAPQGRAGAIESASRATVFLRVIGDIEVVPPPDVQVAEASLRRRNIEIATGSGVLVSPVGQILTCHHVIADGERTGLLDGRKATVLVKVRRIEAFVPAAPGGATAIERYEATVMAASPDLDIAVLSISGGNLPSADLGDSDALEQGDGLDALGFPFGRDVEIGRPESDAPLSPEVSVSHGDFSAFRSDAQGTRRFIQTSAAVNPGSSGGPVVDSDGFVVGIVSRRLSGPASGIGFAVPINLVKEYLESNGLDAQLPARRLSLGPLQPFEGKGLRMRLPWGLSDGSPFRIRVDSGAFPTAVPTLRVDRVLSPWDALRLADVLSSGKGLESFTPMGSPAQRVRVVGARRVVAGRVNGIGGDGTGLRMEYAVLDLGQEKLLARYVGTPAVVAYNASVFRASLASVEADLLRRPVPAVGPPSAWEPIASAAATSRLSQVVVPAGWVQEPLAPLPCRGLQAVAEAAAASPQNDFARTLRVGVVRQAGITAPDAAAACGTPTAPGASDYQATGSLFGLELFVAGRFLQVAEHEVLQFEVVGPADQRPALLEVFRAWMTGRQGG